MYQCLVHINSDEGLIKDLEENPVPYQLLFINSQAPVLEKEGFEIVHSAGEFKVAQIDEALWEKYFKLKKHYELMRFTHKDWRDYPHYARIYFDPVEERLFIKSMTDESYSAMITMVNQLGLNLHYEPDIHLHLLMELMIGEILEKNIILDPYHIFFAEEEIEKDEIDAFDEEDDKAFDNMMAVLSHSAQSGKKPDLKTLASTAKIDLSTVELLYREFSENLKK